ncbi:hypothetical protein RBE51_20795 [Pseudomonas taiwanensis]|nr:hypothetical protein [Pseudomonas taiwanensis]MDT8925235.1 hypothetical protein [Pseudomonas taiwanensis]
MEVKVIVSKAELEEMHMSQDDLHAHVVAALDEADPQVVGFNVEVEVVE